MKWKGKLFKKEKGVSEVLGSILVLLITVMLFSTVFYYVGTMPTPQPKIYAQFDATLHIVPTKTGGYCLNITVKNVGGESLVNWRTMFIVVIDFTAKQHMLSELNFSKQPSLRDGKFSQGESFYYNSTWDHWSWPSRADVKSLNIGITLMGKNTGSIIWSTKLQGRTKMPPVLVGLTSTPPLPILGKPATFKAIVFDPNNPENVGNYRVYLDFSESVLRYSIYGSAIKNMSYSGNNVFTSIVNFKTNDSLNIMKPYTVKVWINDGSNNISYPAHLYVSRGTGNRNPDLYVDSKLITLGTQTPTHGDNVQVSVTIENLGGSGAKFQLRVFDEYPGYKSASNPDGLIPIKTNFGSSEYLPSKDGYYTIAAAGQTTISFIWEDVGANAQGNTIVSKVSGTHHLVFQIINVTPIENPNKYPDTTSISLTVLPSILLVDDDGYAEGANLDTSRYYKYYLDTAGYKYTVDKSTIDTVQLKSDIDSHDLVIWETGYKDNPLTSTQASILQDYVANKGGALWLISQEIGETNLRTVLDDPSINVQKAQDPTSIVKIEGVSGTPINLTLSSGSLISDNLTNRDNAPNGNDTIYLSNLGSYKPFIEGFTENSYQQNPVGVYREFSNGGKIVFTGFEISRVRHYYSQDFIAYRILKWLANITGRAGNDLAVEDMIITPRDPLYKQPVHISVIVSNNGGSPLSSEVLLLVDGINTLNINTKNPNSTGTIPPDGGFVTVNFTWIPTQPGKHILTAIVDPYNRIKETNEENNIINTEIVDTRVFVHFSTLVVYNGTQTYSINEKDSIISTLNVLGYKYKVLDISKTPLPQGYSDGTYFAQYNLILWADAKIGNRDVKAIEDSMSNNPNTGQLFIGSHISYYISSDSSFMNYLQINSMTKKSTTTDSVIFGVNNVNSITNGVSVILAPTGMYNISSNGGMALFSKYGGTSLGYESLENISSEYSKIIPSYGYGIISKVSVSGAKYGILPFGIENIIGIFGLKNASIAKPYDPANQGRAWILFRLFRYFGFNSSKPELATFTSDIQIIYGGDNPNLPPIIGRSYMLRTRVYNYGSEGSNAIVRFYDDFEWIGSKTVYVPPGKYAQIEIDWTPMFAGSARHIRVIVDPLNEVMETQFNGTSYNGKEIFNFNNEAIRTVTVYYFWDNMENGAGNWEHEATVMDINGESPLDFVNREDVNTTVIGDWDWSLSGDTDSSGTYHRDNNIFNSTDPDVVDFTGGAHHSAPNAFWMPEAPRAGARKPVDVIFVIDTSGSMNTTVPGASVGDVNGDGKSNTRIDVAIKAAEDAISELGDNDRVAIFAFDQNGDGHPQKLLDFTYATQSNIIDRKLTHLYAKGGTPLYDTISWAVYYMDNHGRSTAVKGILVLTDGLSNADTYGTADGNQYIYAPGTGTEEVEDGVINNYVKGVTSGLIKVPYSMMTISIAPNAWDGRLFALGNSSTGNVSMALFESKPDAIEGAFTTFISLLTQTASTGGLRATIISNLGAVVFSDGFRDTSWSSPGWMGRWIHHDFYIKSTNDRNKYYKSQSDGWTNKYWVAQTDRDGAYLEHKVYPYDVLHYHYPGSYTIRSANISFWVGVNYNDIYYPDAIIKVYAGGTLIATLNNVLNGVTRDVYGTNYKIDYMDKYEAYCYVEIPPNIRDLNSYDIKIEVQSTNSIIGIDDVMVVYHIDYTPPSHNSGVPPTYSHVVHPDVNYTYLITPPVDVSGAKKVLLSFWTKYWMTQGTNGGIMYMWGSDDETTWTWDQSHRYYIMPTQSYTGNLKISGVNNNLTSGGPKINGQRTGLIDAKSTHPYWCFNGISGSGTFGWDYIEVDLTHYLKETNFRYIRIVFMLVQFGGLPPNGGWNPSMGWYLDDVKISVTSDGHRDLWQLHNFGGSGATEAHSGDYAWAYGNSTNNWALPRGVDSSLITKQIDLTTARTARLSFWIRFNLNSAAGIPPATVRVEVSDDNGMTWQSITYGVRIGWGASGTGGMAGTSANNNYGWVNSGTLARINCDLSGWAGHTIMIRFRVVTNNTDYPTYSSSSDPYGVFLDDVEVYGNGYASTIGVSGNYLWDSSGSTTASVQDTHNISVPHKLPIRHRANATSKFGINYEKLEVHMSCAGSEIQNSEMPMHNEFSMLTRVAVPIEIAAADSRI